MIELGRPCRRYRPALLDFVDHGEIVDPATSQALAHLDRCERCLLDLEATVLAITALRRLGEDAGGVEPAADAWPRLRARLDRWHPARWAIMSPTAGAVMSMALVAVLIAPLQIGDARPSPSPSVPSSERDPASLIERRVEADYISNIRMGPIPASEPVFKSTGTLRRNYPDNVRPERKEVSPAEPSEEPPEAI